MGAEAVITNWAGNVRYGAKRMHRPGTEGELRRIVAGADRIRALGSGHSFNLVADTSGDLIRLDSLPATVEIDRDAAAVTVSAGTRYAELAAALHAEGLALANMASLPHISVAGSVATGTHGSGCSLPSLAAAVTALDLVGPSGDVLTLTRSDDRFPGAVVALGALGVVVRLTLEIEPAFEVAQTVRLDVPLEEAADDFDALFHSAYSVSLFTDWRGDGRVWLKQRLDRPGPGWTGGHAADTPQHPIPGVAPGPATPQLGVPGPWHERLPHFRPEFTPSAGTELQSELFLPRSRAREGFTILRELSPIFSDLLHISEVRTIRADDLWLSPCYERDTVAFHFTWKPVAVDAALAAIEARLIPLGGRPHWGKLTTLAPQPVAALHPRSSDFAALARDLDPDGKFGNALTEALFHP
ncbi:xylitol oxidase [Actinocorallia herbida]|uniref:Xylitol oxidase n=1 Tax=Actinocorallia herbida TaxID=58109 RepID=A0A3N1D2J1_9ACTN|nr:FAD-binding protein [Actinocorallia herbida]ROO87741.1 xylitol oxidase [Actinocorallia herbida]